MRLLLVYGAEVYHDLVDSDGSDTDLRTGRIVTTAGKFPDGSDGSDGRSPDCFATV